MRKFTEEDVRHPQQWALDKDEVLTAFCEAFGMRITTRAHTTGEDVYNAVAADYMTVSGTRAHIVAFVSGYAVAWSSQRARARQHIEMALDELRRKLREV